MNQHHISQVRHGCAWMIHICLLMIFFPGQAAARQAPQPDKRMVRLAILKIDTVHLETYKAFLQEQIETAIRVEPGVLTYYAVADKKHPSHITILEVYASREAYQSHIASPHFLKYKNGTLHMVKSLELVDVDPLKFASKENP